MNYLYLNNPSQQPIPRTFVFNKRNEKIDWRRIGMRSSFLDQSFNYFFDQYSCRGC